VARVPRSMRRAVAGRARGHCEYCRAPDTFSSDLFEVEHIHPRSPGGPTALENLAWAGGGCNLFKANRTEAIDPQSGNAVQLYNPRTDAWDDHFEWTNDLANQNDSE